MTPAEAIDLLVLALARATGQTPAVVRLSVGIPNQSTDLYVIEQGAPVA